MGRASISARKATTGLPEPISAITPVFAPSSKIRILACSKQFLNFFVVSNS